MIDNKGLLQLEKKPFLSFLEFTSDKLCCLKILMDASRGNTDARDALGETPADKAIRWNSVKCIHHLTSL